MKGKITKLINVKSIVTILLTILFFILAIKQIVDANAVITIYTTVIAFYFGTQVDKKGVSENENNSELSNKEELLFKRTNHSSKRNYGAFNCLPSEFLPAIL